MVRIGNFQDLKDTFLQKTARYFIFYFWYGTYLDGVDELEDVYVIELLQMVCQGQ